MSVAPSTAKNRPLTVDESRPANGGAHRAGQSGYNSARLAGLEPAAVWQQFAAISDIPRASGQEGAAAGHVASIARRYGLEVLADRTGNLLIRKPATEGMSDRATIALQCHLDMVQIAKPGLAFDFARQPIPIRVDGDWLRTEGTTLGADNGIGVAMIVAVLCASDLRHPPIEALFTVDEEIGMTGALAVTPDLLTADMLINLDMGCDRDLTVGCAGAVDVLASGTYAGEVAKAPLSCRRITVTGGTGGHSGEDIHMSRANAIRLLAEILSDLSAQTPFRLIHMEATGPLNAIPGTAQAIIAVAPEVSSRLVHQLDILAARATRHFVGTDPALTVVASAEQIRTPEMVPEEVQQRLLQAILHTPLGVQTMSERFAGYVETSSNLGALCIGRGRFAAASLVRSSSEAGKSVLTEAIHAAWHATGARCTTANDTPAWSPKPQNLLLDVMSAAHLAISGDEPRVLAIHAGLECGVFAARFPHLCMVAYGPNMHDIHTPKERLQIGSVQKVWAVLTQTLANIPPKGSCHGPD